ncbi:MAG: MFS transporter, partial [Caulobacterales bacterium]|nr:MFS transporter [Caulobacterales bacterium]
MDRQVLSIVQEDVKLDLGLSDGQLGLFALAFGTVHAICALPLGRVADKAPRKTVLIACLTVWSSMTAVAGMAGNFVQLLLARMGVAAGEAGVTPTSYSMISDKFPVRRRATALAVVGAGIPVGLMFSLLLGGVIADNLGWRWTFVIFGLPGLVLALIFALTIQAPARGEADGLSKTVRSSFAASLSHLLTTRSFLLVITGAMT